MTLAAVQAAGQTDIKVYPTDLRVNVGETATFTALAFEEGTYLANKKFSFVRVAGRRAVASVRNSPEGNTEGPNSYSSHNLAEVLGTSPGPAIFVARAGNAQSPPVTVTVVDPAAPPDAVIHEGSGGNVVNTILARTGEAIEVDAGGSSGVDKIEWFWGDGDRTGDILSATHAYLVAGTYQLRLKITNQLGTTAEAVVTVIVTPFPPPARTFIVTTIPQLLNAYSQCKGGEHIVIPSGTVLIGEIELPARDFSDFVTIRSGGETADLPVRVDPHQITYATLKGGHPGEIPLTIKNKASKIRLSGLKFEPFSETDDTIRNYYMLQIGEAFAQRTAADNPSQIIVDHCVIDPPDNIQVVHGILNDGYRVAIISSWLGNIKTYGGQDSQAVFSVDGRGAHVYNNTFFEAASESIMYGGADNRIEGLVPTNIEFRRCVFSKRLGWRNLRPNSVGDTINIKNLFETKNARRVYVEGSLFSNHWDAGRSQYFALLIKSTADRPGGGQGSPWAISEDIIFENNRISHINGAMAVTREFSDPDIIYDPRKPRNIRAINSLFDDLTFGRWGTARSWSFYIAGVDGFSLKHISVIDAMETPDEPAELMVSLGSINIYGLEIIDSILPLNFYGIRNSCGEGVAALNVATSGWFDPVSGSSCSAVSSAGKWNVVGNVIPRLRTAPVTQAYPTSNHYPANYSEIGMIRYRTCNGTFLTEPCEGPVDNFGLNDDTRFKGTATDKTDPGVNVEVLNERIRCTRTGDTSPCLASPIQDHRSRPLN
ncbi:MAG: PKD domain-containing protein [Pyrinomonadaceae bacterium]